MKNHLNPLNKKIYLSIIGVAIIFLFGFFKYGYDFIFDSTLSLIIIALCIKIFSRVDQQNNPASDVSDEDIESFTSKVFQSKSFLNAFETSLPKGNDDDDLGLDYIPFMLENIKQRRERFTKSSNRFLGITIVLGTIFISITVWFGYILINEDEIGTQRIINRIDDKLESINSNLDLQGDDIFTDKRFIEICGDNLNELENTDLTIEKTITLRNRVNSLLREVKKSNNSIQLRDSLNILTNEAKRETNFEIVYANKLDDFQTSFLTFLREKEGSYSLLSGNIERFENDLTELKSSMNKPENRLVEMIKRLILSLVMITFFLAILKYIVGLYKSHLTEMIKTEREDLVIRKFYVILKSMKTASEEKSKILTSFLEGNSGESNSDSDSTINKDELSILKNVIDALVKKI
ncbi:MAG: hypothetical protein GQ574_08355 [Crocinitomix sp.]|nr:hypothetical protein [Crocinitomix sp.]